MNKAWSHAIECNQTPFPFTSLFPKRTCNKSKLDSPLWFARHDFSRSDNFEVSWHTNWVHRVNTDFLKCKDVHKKRSQCTAQDRSFLFQTWFARYVSRVTIVSIMICPLSKNGEGSSPMLFFVDIDISGIRINYLSTFYGNNALSWENCDGWIMFKNSDSDIL